MILDVCCGPRHMWFDKERIDVIYGDRRQEKHVYHSDKWGDREWEISPDILIYGKKIRKAFYGVGGATSF